MYNSLARMRNFYYISSARTTIFLLNFSSKMAPDLAPLFGSIKEGTFVSMNNFIKRRNELFAREKLVLRYFRVLTQLMLEDDLSDERFLELYREEP